MKYISKIAVKKIEVIFQNKPKNEMGDEKVYVAILVRKQITFQSLTYFISLNTPK